MWRPDRRAIEAPRCRCSVEAAAKFASALPVTGRCIPRRGVAPLLLPRIADLANAVELAVAGKLIDGQVSSVVTVEVRKSTVKYFTHKWAMDIFWPSVGELLHSCARRHQTAS
jgi:hypothetical protein